jgi:VanZ family protein
MQNKKIQNLFWVGIPILALLLIFHNSMYPLIQSDLQSGVVLNALNRFFADHGIDAVLTQFEVRKLAHFIEYFIFGFLFTVAIQTIRKRLPGSFFFELFYFLAFPVVDETIQLYSPGRGSSVSDVLIGFASCMIGMGLCRLIFRRPETNDAAQPKPAVKGRDRAWRRILTAATVLFILFIFLNSMFPGPQSSSQSQYVMNLLNHMLAVLQSPVMLSEHFVRKAGHFTEYFAFGILLLITVRSYRKPVRKSVFAGMFFLLLVPVIDEFIQLFTPKRGSSVLDVLLDFGGGIVGMALCWLIVRLKQRYLSH